MKKILLLLSFIILPFFAHCQCWSSVSTGGNHTIAIAADGALWGWGRNQTGQLGTGNSTAYNVPTKVGILQDWQKISAGNSHCLAIKTNGTLWSWGRNSLGQLGNGAGGSGIFSNVPVQIGTATDWVFIAAGDEFSTAIKANGTLWAWGDNQYGQCGDGTQINKNVPTQIGTLTNWSKISAGANHSVAIKTDGTLWAWGYNNSGQLGDGTAVLKTAPIQIGTANNWQTVCARLFHTVALKADNSLWTWGSNSTGQLGDGTIIDKNTPQNIDATNTYSLISAGSQHTIAKKATGTIWSWGSNISGQMGDGTTVSKSSPTASASAINNWAFITSKISHSAALRPDGTLYCWGSNIYGQVGDGTNANKTAPTLIVCPTLSNQDFNVFDNSFNLYPNPTNGLLNIEINENSSINKVMITDFFGKIVFNQSKFQSQIDVSDLSNGMYFIQLFSDNNTFVRKFVKAN